FVIKNFRKFMVETKSDREHANDSEYIRDKEYIMWNFEEVILPFWEEEIEQIVVGGEKRVFNVYCVD
ncbi:hypothetical protein KG091_08970, partial [Carnobacteriaceae bacterium zg-ZUI78]|nr:hypothetical protein [Carnobacteriaceae bacterium zg-ZUI78]